MSRTDVHRPWRVQVADPHNRHPLYRFQVYPSRPDGVELMPWKNIGCGYRMCTGHFVRRWERRRERHQTKRALRLGDPTSSERDARVAQAGRAPSL